MVTLQILVLSFLVRIQVAQHNHQLFTDKNPLKCNFSGFLCIWGYSVNVPLGQRNNLRDSIFKHII